MRDPAARAPNRRAVHFGTSARIESPIEKRIARLEKKLDRIELLLERLLEED